MKRALDNSFQALSSSLPATVGLAIAAADGRLIALGTWFTGVAWSTIKVPLVIAALRAGTDRSDLLYATITQSDNAAAEALWSQLGHPAEAARRVQAVIRDAGDATTVVESRRLRMDYTPFGQTRWGLADQARFAAGLSQVTGPAPVIELMGRLTPAHRWGLAAKGFAAKGGWGPGLGADYLIRQFAIIPAGAGNIGVALAAEVSDGGYEAGIDVVNSLTDWVVDEVLAE